jgi:hypothetical protein
VSVYLGEGTAATSGRQQHASGHTYEGAGMGLINWIFDIYQHTKIDEARKEAMEARLEAARINRGGSTDAQRLERVMGELALATKTLQRLMIDKGVCTHDELWTTLLKIDGEDGAHDGRSPI